MSFLCWLFCFAIPGEPALYIPPNPNPQHRGATSRFVQTDHAN